MTPEQIRAHILKRLEDGPADIAALGAAIGWNGYDKAYRQVMSLKGLGLIEEAYVKRGASYWKLKRGMGEGGDE